MVGVVQLVRASDCGSECRGFESHPPPQQVEGFPILENLFLLHINLYYNYRHTMKNVFKKTYFSIRLQLII